MKNQFLLSIAFTIVLALTLSSCTKSVCNTCTLDHSPSIRVELCDGISTTYDGNTIILEEDISGFPIAIYLSSLRAAGYKCN